MSLIPKYAFRACTVTPLQHGAVSITGPCYQCGKKVSVAVEATDLEKWRHGAYVQDCFPYLGAAEREFLMSGICGQCWSELFGDDDEEENPDDS